MEIIKITICPKKSIDIELITGSPDHDLDNLKSGDYALVRIDSLNDRIAVEEFIEGLKTKQLCQEIL